MFRVQDGQRGRKDLGNLVVVRYDNLHAIFHRPADLIDIGDPAVCCDHQFCTLGVYLLYRLDIQPIAFIQAMGKMEVYLGTRPPQEEQEQSSGCSSVNVVIAEDGDFLPVPDGPGNPTDRFFHVLHGQRIWKVR